MIKLHFTTLTPLHISNGEQLGQGLNYILLNKSKLCKLKLSKVADNLAKENKFDFKENYDVNKIVKVIKDYLQSLFNNQMLTDDFFEYKIPITDSFKSFYKNDNSDGQKFVQEFINSNGKFYIPASSVKGALLTVLNQNSLGIDVNNARIEDKFVFTDSDSIDSSNLMVYRTNNRPPATNMICIKPQVSFIMTVRKKGNLNINTLRENLKVYSSNQINLAMEKLQPYKTKRNEPKGADIFENALKNINPLNLNKGEYLINVGFGGGSWFKIEKNNIPMFPSKSPTLRGQREPAHTSVSFNENPLHIGWCKLKIEET